ncbi:MAG: SET domain-containing protein-lysine N-methyltransferase [Bacteroidetes bacterium GWF2_42_66]|nr:MAG: SET domain-containing protein-lysine N-methyltransferase [Bacteroidetes bacterium GWA2_42_15]OFX99694.1 MAG: SET domain-containing protein-lysine N-methyltransferase [Bacteroidetes bacterium GWE2_42_39]OFY39732.1 MAG: SET domain-containing protein-lysine N-methyltransferase [Bacteroidetes bacterium GWF2_42_66]HBL74853.1 SET domain-containing protein-lysine N-methyltransferase [Prolixibacteraceae bacterium]HCR90792.1 SET domain-containing protein-lysine N-methyltransferase [Prolixibacter
MIHPHTELQFINEEIGYGVVAKKLIKKGTITWAFDQLDREYTPAQIGAMDEVYRDVLMTYTFRNRKGNHVFCWDHGRYVNHSFRPNCMATAYNFEIAIRNIQPGEQLTNDYGYLNIIEAFRPYPEGTRREVVYPDDLIRYSGDWDRKILPAFLKIRKTEQPLGRVIDPEVWEKINAVIDGKVAMESIRACYFDPDAEK